MRIKNHELMPVVYCSLFVILISASCLDAAVNNSVEQPQINQDFKTKITKYIISEDDIIRQHLIAKNEIKYKHHDTNTEIETETAKILADKLRAINQKPIVAPRKPKDFLLRSPVVFIPGDGGSQLEARLNKPSRVHYICDLKSDWFDIWLNLHLLSPFVIDCLIDNMRLFYNKTNHRTYNNIGVEIRPTNFGSVDSVEYLDTLKVLKTDYFYSIIDQLVRNNSYTRNVDLRGAAYDFRKGPNELQGFFAELSTLIEDTYIESGSKPVTLICHSMGCLNTVYLLNHKSSDWRTVFVKRLISIAAPWAGSFKAVTAMLFGDNLGVPVLSSTKLQGVQSTFPSLMYLFPKEPTFKQNESLIETPSFNFTLNNLDRLFDSVNMTDQMYMWHDTKPYLNNLTAPDVEFWCLYSKGYPTPRKLVFQSQLMDGKYEEIEGDGDGTVNLDSLESCKDFGLKQEKKFKAVSFDKLDHIDILRSPSVANYIATHIMSCDDPKDSDCFLNK